jgi:hypothetical protein
MGVALLMVCGAFRPCLATAAGPMTILYSADERGEIEPCG